MSYWLNPRISVEQCRELDQMKLDAYTKAVAKLDAAFKRDLELYGIERAMEFQRQMYPILAMMLF
jgi:hypothetical protein